MVRTGLSIVLVVAFAPWASAADGPERGRTPRVNALPVSAILEQAAKSPLTPGEAGLLRAVADLVEKEHHATADRWAMPSSKPVIVSGSGAEEVQATPPIPTRDGAPAEQRMRLAFRLSHAPVVHVAKSLEEFLDSEQEARRPYEQVPNHGRAIFVPEPISNTLLVSGTPRVVDSVAELIAALDQAPPAVMVNVCIAEMLPPLHHTKTDDGLSDDSAAEEAPSMEKDGAAWLAWAQSHGRLNVLSRPRIMTLDNQPAILKIGATVPIGAPKPGTDGPDKDNLIEQTEVGLTVGLTPRISPEGLVFVELHVERASMVNRDGAAGPTIRKTTVQTTISAKDGQTIVLGGLIERRDDGPHEMIVAVTPWVKPAGRPIACTSR